MDTELKNRIIDFLETVVESHGDEYPSKDAEIRVLYDVVSSEFKISKRDASYEVLGFLWRRESTLNT